MQASVDAPLNPPGLNRSFTDSTGNGSIRHPADARHPPFQH